MTHETAIKRAQVVIKFIALMTSVASPPGLSAIATRRDVRWRRATRFSSVSVSPRVRSTTSISCEDMGTRGDGSLKAGFSGNRKEPSTKDGEYVSNGAKPWDRPKRIVLLRHAESEGNVDETMYMRKPDHRIELTEKGKQQARAAGEELKKLLGPNETLYVYVSPYLRTMQTLYELGQAVGVDRVLGVREEPRIREQDFGNFQDATMQELKKERLGFGRFFYRFPNGESAADVYDRVTSFRETLRNDIHFGRFNCDDRGCRTDDCTVVIVTHGLTLRVFLMRWYKWTTDQFTRLKNPGNAELIVMERGDGGRYTLLNQTHSEDYLIEKGFTEPMIQDQKWAKVAPVDGLNSEWPTSKGDLFFENFPKRLEANRASVLNADKFFERRRREQEREREGRREDKEKNNW